MEVTLERVSVCSNCANIQRNYETQLNAVQQHQITLTQLQNTNNDLRTTREALANIQNNLEITQKELEITKKDLNELRITVTPLLRQQTRLALGQIVYQVNQLLSRLSNVQIEDAAKIQDAVKILRENHVNSPYFQELTKIGVDEISRCLEVLRYQRRDIAHPTILEDYTSDDLKNQVAQYFKRNPYQGFGDTLTRLIDWMYLVDEHVH